tara:strand:- start:6155 stop:6394 length:240 start_codon:yes stop_codon:yes gene_type:complete
MSDDIKDDIDKLTETLTTAVGFPTQMVTDCMEHIIKTDAMIQELARESRRLTLMHMARMQMLITEMADNVNTYRDGLNE